MPIILCILILAAVPGAARGLPDGPPVFERFEYVSPLPGARYVQPQSDLLFRPVSGSAWTGSCAVYGSSSGRHGGEWIRASDGKTRIFRPYDAFSPGERVTVSLSLAGAATLTYDFEVTPKVLPPRSLAQQIECLRPPAGLPTPTRKPTGMARTQPVSSLPPGFPSFTVTVSDEPSNGYIFLGNMAFSETIDTPFHLMVVDNTGQPVFFRETWNAVVDFKVQPNGWLTYFVLGDEKFHAMDSTYTVVDSFSAGNGYVADFHDLQVLPNGHALLLIYDPQPVDMSQIVSGGNPNATVIGLVIQELDTSKNLVFQWRSWDHFQITDSNIDLTTQTVDYVHGNSLAPDGDGNIILSSRHLDEITKINRATGAVIWRMGGTQNQFTLQGDTRWFSRQHDVRRLANGHLTMFDNANVLRRSRSVEYTIDETNKILTRVWDYLSTPPVWGWAMGSSQRLGDGNTMIGWGSANPTVTEVRPDGTKAFEMTMPDGIYSYRALRFEWNGTAVAPYLWSNSTETTASLGFRKFGDDTVQKYFIYRDETPAPSTLVDSTSQNSIDLAGLTHGVTYYFRVRALYGASELSPYSNGVAIMLEPPTGVGGPPSPAPGPVLGQNYPNPFNPSTVIPYRIDRAARVTLAIYDVTGRLVRRLVDATQDVGSYESEWDGRNEAGAAVTSGVYYCRLRVGDATRSRRLTVVR